MYWQGVKSTAYGVEGQSCICIWDFFVQAKSGINMRMQASACPVGAGGPGGA